MSIRDYIPISIQFGNKKLAFEPSKLSLGLLQEYLKNILEDISLDSFKIDSKSLRIPNKYLDNPLDASNYKVLLDLSFMSIKNWKKQLQETNTVDFLFTQENASIENDAKYYYESFQIIEQTIGDHHVQFSFFRLLYEIIHELSSRNYTEIDDSGMINMIDISSITSTEKRQENIIDLDYSHTINTLDDNIDSSMLWE